MGAVLADQSGFDVIAKEIVRPTRARAVDWTRLRREYVEGTWRDNPATGGPEISWPSLREVARANGVNEGWVRGRASRDRWVLAREQWQAKVEAGSQELRAKNMAKHLAKMDDLAISAARQGLALVLSRLGEIAEQQRSKSGGAGHAATLDAGEVENLVRAAAACYDLGREALGVEGPMNIQVSGGIETLPKVRPEVECDDSNRLQAFLAAVQHSGLLAP